MRIFKDIQYKEYEYCQLDMYLPEKSEFDTIVWFHGGGLTAGDKSSGEKLAEGFVEAGYGFVSVNYRMYNHGSKFPDFLIDAADAVAFVEKNIEEYGGNANRLYISGQSAGAWISLMLCMNAEYLKNVGIDNQKILGWIIDSAQTTSHFNVIQYELGEDKYAQRIDKFAPQYFVSKDTCFSKMLLIFYENDMTCRYEQNMLFYKSILAYNKEANVRYTVLSGGHCHGSSKMDEDGKYAYVKTSLQWLKETEE